MYLQFDKAYYATGDTLWFKAYLLNSAYLTASTQSGILYIDIANDSNKVIKEYRFPVKTGLSWGNISLDEKEYRTGTYALRAWTQWMRNRGDTDFFYKQFYISSAGEHNWLVSTRFKTNATNGYLTDAGLQFSNMDKTPFAAKIMQLQVMSGNKELYSKKLQTDAEGKLDVNFTVPQKASEMSIVAQDEQKEKKAIVPVPLNQPENADVQFMPEGGKLVAGLPARVGFKAIGEDGKGINISGTVIDQEQNTVASFNAIHNGMGSFVMNIKPGETYTANVKLADGSIQTYALPAVKSSGTILAVKNPMQGDSVEVVIAAADDIAQSGENYFLIGKARGIVCYAAIVNLTKDQNAIRRQIAKNLFPGGITHFILMTTGGQPLNERLVYIDHYDNLNIQVKTNEISYMPHDSIALHLDITNADGKPVAANFSMAVTDDMQVKNDTINNDNIITRTLLTADLKGYIETPGYYTNKDAKTWQALDDLLLTQGWTSYQPINDQPKFQYLAEKEFIVSGRVSNVFGRPVKKSDVQLFSKSPIILMDTTTNDQGRFVFDHLPRVDTPVFIIRAVNKSGKSFNVNVEVDDIKPPVFTPPSLPVIGPWYINSDTTLLNFTRTDNKAKQLQYTPQGVHVLQEVKITAKKIVKGSQNLNGAGNADFVLDEKDMEAAGKKTWLQLLQERIKGFGEGTFFLSGKGDRTQKDFALIDFVTDIQAQFKPENQYWYFVNGSPIKFIVDGVPVYKIFTLNPNTPVIADITYYLKSHSAEDIKGVEVLFSAKYVSKYIPMQWTSAILPGDVAFVEITTRSGNGPAIYNTPGVYLYKPLAISYPKQFYKPKYTVTDTTKKAPDLRSTIDWEPNVVTNANGEATVSFYAADMPTTYTIILEGSDMNGSLGYKRQKITVTKSISNGRK
ncbi:MAG: carboxypeptidase-like regulatory domain-containing protein [Mucilaginibacter sp.]